MSDHSQPLAPPVGGAVAQSADAALLESLVREHREAAVAYARRILGDASLAEDAVQRALLQILLRVRAGDHELLAANPRALVLRGTRWAALKLADRHSSRDEAERRAAGEALVGAADDHDWDRLEARMLVEDILPSLPEHYRDVLRLRYLEGRPDASAARDLAVTLKAYRRRLDRALAVARVAALRIGVTSLGAALLNLLRRARGRTERVLLSSDRSAWSPVSSGSSPLRASLGNLALAVAIVGLVVGTPVVHHADPSGPGTRFGQGDRLLPFASVAPAGVATAPAPAGHTALALASAHGRFVRPAGPPSSASGETLDDVSVSEMAQAPQASQNHTVIADGIGGRCACHVFLQTTDGGATWSAYPATGDQLLLPPDYPRDPRIFVRAPAQLFGFGFCVERRISDGICAADPRVPYGTGGMALDPAFDAGRPVIYISTPGGALAFNDVTGTSAPLELNSTMSIDGLVMAATGGAGPWGVYLLVRGAQMPQGTTVTPSTPGIAAAPWVGAQHLVGCRADGSCKVLAGLPDSMYQLYGDEDDSSGRVVVGYDGTVFDVSTDSGATQRSVAAPAGMLLDLRALGSGASLELTASIASPNWTHRMLATWRAATGWQYHYMDAIAPSMAQPLEVPLGGGRVLVGLSGQRDTGLWCTTDAGAHWARVCPPAP